jgi:hypothetical protein
MNAAVEIEHNVLGLVTLHFSAEFERAEHCDFISRITLDCVEADGRDVTADLPPALLMELADEQPDAEAFRWS